MAGTIRSRAGSCVWLVAWFCLCAACSAGDYEYGNLVADVPEHWSPTQITLPGTTLVAFSNGKSSKDDQAVLFWIEAASLSGNSAKQFVDAVVTGSGLKKVAPVSEQSSPRVHSLILNAEFEGRPVRGAVYGLDRDEHLYAFAFIAAPEKFESMHGRELPLVAFNQGRSLPVAPPAESPGPNTALARAKGGKLTQKMAGDMLAFSEFLAARDVSAADKAELRRRMIEEFPKASPEEVAAYRDVSVLMGQLATLSPMRRAELRRDLMNRIWFDAQKEEDTELIDMVYRYNPVLGVDKKLGLVVTRASYDALLTSNSFVAVKAGLKPLTPAQRDRAADELSRKFSSLDEKQKRYLNDAEVNWLKVVTAWQIWDEQQRKTNLGIVGIAGVSSPDDVPQVARNLEHWAGIAVNNAKVMEMVGMQGNMMALEQLRGMLSEN